MISRSEVKSVTARTKHKSNEEKKAHLQKKTAHLHNLLIRNRCISITSVQKGARVKLIESIPMRKVQLYESNSLNISSFLFIYFFILKAFVYKKTSHQQLEMNSQVCLFLKQ